MKPTNMENLAGNVGLSMDELQSTRQSVQSKVSADTGLPTMDLTDPNAMKQAVTANLPLTSSSAGVRPMGPDEATSGAFAAMASAVDNERTLAAYYTGI